MQCGGAAEQRAASTIMQILPSPVRPAEIGNVLSRLNLLRATPAMKMSPVGTHAGLNYVLKELTQLSQGHPLEFKSDEVSKLSRDCVNLLQHFLRRTLPMEQADGKDKNGIETADDAAAPVMEVTGEAAYRNILGLAVFAVAGSWEGVQPQDLEDLVCFRHLAAADISELAVATIQQLQCKTPPEKKAKAVACTTASSASANGTAPHKKSLAKQAAEAMFV